MFKFLIIIPLLQIFNGVQIEGKKNASQTESPYMVYFSVKNRVCGGALISDTHILTAAHCFDRLKYSELTSQDKLKKAVKIRIGEWKTETDPDCGENESGESCDTTADIFPKNIIIHADYKRNTDSTFKNDIAIIQLKWPPRRSELIHPIALAKRNRCQQHVSGEHWKTTGFGYTPGNSNYSSVKKISEFELLSNEECEKSLNNGQLRKFNTETHVCAKGVNGEKTCKGDAGSAVTNIVNGVPYLQGIVSFVHDEEECDNKKSTASVILKVSCFYDWIWSKVPDIKESYPSTTQKVDSSEDEDRDTEVEGYIAHKLTEKPILGTTDKQFDNSKPTTPKTSTVDPNIIDNEDDSYFDKTSVRSVPSTNKPFTDNKKSSTPLVPTYKPVTRKPSVMKTTENLSGEEEIARPTNNNFDKWTAPTTTQRTKQQKSTEKINSVDYGDSDNEVANTGSNSNPQIINNFPNLPSIFGQPNNHHTSYASSSSQASSLNNRNDLPEVLHRSNVDEELDLRTGGRDIDY